MGDTNNPEPCPNVNIAVEPGRFPIQKSMMAYDIPVYMPPDLTHIKAAS